MRACLAPGALMASKVGPVRTGELHPAVIVTAATAIANRQDLDFECDENAGNALPRARDLPMFCPPWSPPGYRIGSMLAASKSVRNYENAGGI
jgi:hypothetical protein